ncbi:aldehyde dehydrogenase family protein [Paenibacillus sp. HJL G12]|uniref:Aldehyde dehydrogenase n=1 Tax=Paenibacillus dendrobii TaxID=2691084 RepID=A0A7X3LKS1_9BACL|nr:aldehyde dehydrogenase [Paenibacillus dendrobii]MWV46883.1 aldehyde dehydrogenase family protein [Paenibacillus dendrobii]
MYNDTMADLIQKQKHFYRSGATRPFEYRLRQLKKLREALIANEKQIIEALKMDLNKSEFEAYSTEIGIVYEELSFTIKHLRSWMVPKKAKTALTHFGSKGRIIPEPYGTTLIIAPWNYPFQLAVSPLIGALAAGNTAVMKPSELTPTMSTLLAKILGSVFEEEYVAVIEGGADVSQELLAQPLDYIFFTGSVNVGKIVMQAAAKQLIPLTLELGGKSPCIVHADAPLKLTAQRIVFGKFTNAGQTCIAPDYLLVHRSVKTELITCIQEAIREFYGPDPLSNTSYGRIVSEKHFHRLASFLQHGNVVSGGSTSPDNLTIEPTLLEQVTWDMPVMQEEIFGPILPIMEYDRIQEAVDMINARPKPLALYLFTREPEIEETVVGNVSYGGGCINDTLMHIATPYLPFGGVGESGMGAYHGRGSFDTFTHYKSVLKQTNLFDFTFRYPSSKNGLKYLRKLLKP